MQPQDLIAYVDIDDTLTLDPESSWARPAQPGGVDPQSVSRESVIDAMRQVGGVQAKAWPLLGLKNRYALGRLISKYGIEPEEYG